MPISGRTEAVSAMTHTDESRRGLWILAILATALGVLSFLCVHWDIDRRSVALFYFGADQWKYGDAQPWRFLYQYGTIPGLLLMLASLGALFIPRLRDYRRYALLVLMTGIIGAGILVNGVLKPYWGRPRPREVIEFGGISHYRPFYSPGIPGKGKSFTCGHCTMGYVFISLLFLRRRFFRLAIIGGGFGFVYGTLLGIARIVQGAHFPTDVLWSLGIIALLATTLYYFVLKIPQSQTDDIPFLFKRPRTSGIIAGVLAILMVTGFLLHRPFYETYTFSSPVPAETTTFSVAANVEFKNIEQRFTAVDRLQIIIRGRGFGWLKVKHGVEFHRRQVNDTLIVDTHIDAQGIFTELEHEIEIILPVSMKDVLHVEFSNES